MIYICMITRAREDKEGRLIGNYHQVDHYERVRGEGHLYMVDHIYGHYVRGRVYILPERS